MTKLKGVFLEFVFTTLPSWCRCKLFPLGKYKYNYKMSQELHHFKPQNICGKVYIEKYGLNQLYFYMFLISKNIIVFACYHSVSSITGRWWHVYAGAGPRAGWGCRVSSGCLCDRTENWPELQYSMSHTAREIYCHF